MKLFKFGLRLWMTLVSVVSFLLGWVVLAHAQKPIQPHSASSAVSVTLLPTLVPLAPINIIQNNGTTSQPLTVAPAPTEVQVYVAPQPPVFNTGGS